METSKLQDCKEMQDQEWEILAVCVCLRLELEHHDDHDRYLTGNLS